MSIGDVTVATLAVSLATPNSIAGQTPVFKSPAPDPVQVTFYRVTDKPLILRAGIAGQQTFGEIPKAQWFQWHDEVLNSWYSFGPAEDGGENTKLRWGVVSGDDNQGRGVLLTLGGTVAARTTTSTQAVIVTGGSTSSTPSVTATSSPTNIAPEDPVTNSTTQGPQIPGSAPQGLQGGAIAGIVIGCLVVVALIAGLIFWFCWGKRKGSRSRDYEASSAVLMPQEKGLAAQAIPPGNGSSTTSPASVVLPLPLEDKSITSEISKISSSIKNHVQSYYHMNRVSPGLIDLDDIQAMGDKQPISASTLSTLLSNPKTREMALRFCIGWVACSRMRPDEDPQTSLLPVELAGYARKITNEPRGTTAHDSSMLAQWRVTTAESLQNSYVREPFTASDSRNRNIQKATLTIDNILRPFADSRMDSGDRKRNLEEILKRSALFAFTLFSQSSVWVFDWREKSSAISDKLCIFPALVQVSNENGQPVNPPRAFSEAVVRDLSA